ncbi:hypothetical protein SLS60_009452 [Paraconiothyrium brasiliense]|uniref:Uncharacterized protein n=1 Tax=Paraconiothyrium brasiliense TaxID=300254 RepID=A0ABR3QUC0_9PLEO
MEKAFYRNTVHSLASTNACHLFIPTKRFEYTMSDRTRAALSVVRREEEDNDRNRDYEAEAQDFNDNAELPGNNDAADVVDGTAPREHAENAQTLAEGGADDGYTNEDDNDN